MRTAPFISAQAGHIKDNRAAVIVASLSMRFSLFGARGAVFF
jgi:hypothetical protein